MTQEEEILSALEKENWCASADTLATHCSFSSSTVQRVVEKMKERGELFFVRGLRHKPTHYSKKKVDPFSMRPGLTE